MDQTTLLITVIASNFMLMLTSIGISITLFIKSDSRIDASLKAIGDEMRDFHSRLCIIEERNSQRIFK